MKTLLFSSSEIAQIVKSVGFDRIMEETIAALQKACENFEPAEFSIPVRAGFSYSDDKSKGLVEWMPAIRYGDQVVVKLVGYHPNNPARFNMPTVLSTIVTFDTLSGHATNIIDATFLTSLRTGAASAVASSVLAKPQSRVLGLIGAGAQAVTQLHALSRLFDFDKVVFFDTDMQASSSLVARASYAGISIPMSSATMEEILRAADIICTSTSINVGEGPLFEDSILRPGAHINAIGSDFPGKTELPKSLLLRSLVCPDFLDQAMVEGECQQLQPDEVGPDLLTLVKEGAKYAEYRNTTTVFDSTGWAFEDLVAVEVLANLGAETGCGLPIDFECISEDPRNPYGFVDRYVSLDEHRLNRG